MTCYSFDTEWPGKDKLRSEPRDVSPVILPSPESDRAVSPVSLFDGMSLAEYMKASSEDVDDMGTPLLGRPPSVFSLEGDASEGDVVLSHEAFVRAQRRSVKVGVARARLGKDVPPVPAVGRTFAMVDGINGLKNTMSSRTMGLGIGNYYSLHGFSGDVKSNWFPSGIQGVMAAAHNRSVTSFMHSLDPSAALEARQRAVVDLNRATVKYRAVGTVMAGVRKQKDKLSVLDAKSLLEWFEMARDMVIGNDATIRDCLKVLETAGTGEVSLIDPALFAEDEKDYVGAVLNVLRACVAPASGYADAGESFQVVDSGSMDEVLEHTVNYKHLLGRVNMRISGRSLRERVANMILGGKSVEVDAVYL